MVLVDRVWRGQKRKLLLHADRNGHFYVLDRTNGKFLSGTPFVYQNWNAGFDAERPAAAGSRIELEPEGQLPRLSDARRRHELPGAVLQPAHRLVLSRVSRKAASSTSARRSRLRAASSIIGRGRAAVRRRRAARTSRPPNAGIKAIDPETGKTDVGLQALSRGRSPTACSRPAATSLFVSSATATSWRSTRRPANISGTSRPAATMQASPMSYAIDGKQYVALAAGNVVFSFTLTGVASGADETHPYARGDARALRATAVPASGAAIRRAPERRHRPARRPRRTRRVCRSSRRSA